MIGKTDLRLIQHHELPELDGGFETRLELVVGRISSCSARREELERVLTLLLRPFQSALGAID